MNQNLGLAAQAGMCQAFGLGKFSRHPTLIAPKDKGVMQKSFKIFDTHISLVASNGKRRFD